MVFLNDLVGQAPITASSCWNDTDTRLDAVASCPIMAISIVAMFALRQATWQQSHLTESLPDLCAIG